MISSLNACLWFKSLISKFCSDFSSYWPIYREKSIVCLVYVDGFMISCFGVFQYPMKTITLWLLHAKLDESLKPKNINFVQTLNSDFFGEQI